MTITVDCPFCSTSFDIKPGRLVAPKRAAAAVNCPTCDCRVHVDLKVRRAGQSKKFKDAVARRDASWEAEARAMYEVNPGPVGPRYANQDVEDATHRTWADLPPFEKRVWYDRAKGNVHPVKTYIKGE